VSPTIHCDQEIQGVGKEDPRSQAVEVFLEVVSILLLPFLQLFAF
jgi:hypothetical protein